MNQVDQLCVDAMQGLASIAELERFAVLVAQRAAEAEREACVQACHDQALRWVDDRARYCASECAAAIRARSINKEQA